MSGMAGLSGWRWIFILEGIASVVIGAACFFFLPDSPALASRWLSPEEARFLELLHDATRGRIEEAVKQVVTDWQLYVQAFVFNGVGIPLYGMKFTMPQIVKNLGYSSEKAQLLTAP
jgi:MFS family permease